MPDYSYNVKIAAHSQQAADDKMRQLDPDPEVIWEYVGSEPLDSELTVLRRILRDYDPDEDCDRDGVTEGERYLVIERNNRGSDPVYTFGTGNDLNALVTNYYNQESFEDWYLEALYDLTTGDSLSYEVKYIVTIRGECPSCGERRDMTPGSQCPNCGHIEPKETED